MVHYGRHGAPHPAPEAADLPQGCMDRETWLTHFSAGIRVLSKAHSLICPTVGSSRKGALRENACPEGPLDVSTMSPNACQRCLRSIQRGEVGRSPRATQKRNARTWLDIGDDPGFLTPKPRSPGTGNPPETVPLSVCGRRSDATISRPPVLPPCEVEWRRGHNERSWVLDRRDCIV